MMLKKEKAPERMRQIRHESKPWRAESLLYLILGTVLALAPAAGQTANRDPLMQLYRDAVRAEQKADYPAATRLYEQIVAMRPDLAEAHANLGNLHYVQGHYDQARRSFQTAAKLKPQLAGPNFFLGVLAFRNNDLPNAENLLRKAAALEPENPQIQLHLGYVSYARGQYAAAIGQFEKALAADDKNEDAWYHLSKACSQQSRRHFDELQRGFPDSYYTRLARAHFFEAQGSWQEAIQEYSRAGEQQPGASLSGKLEYLKALAAGQEVPFVPAGEEIDGSTLFLHSTPAASDIPNLYQKWKATAISRPDTGGKAAPRHLYQQAEAYQLLSYLASLAIYASGPDSYRAHQLKGQSLEAAGRTDEAIAEYQKALEKNPQLRSVHFAIGNLYWRIARFDEALQELEAELALNPNDPETHFEVGDILFTQGKTEQAAQHFLRSLQYAPQTAEAHLALERIYSSTGSPEKALYHLNQAARIAPGDATPHYRMWLLYRKQGRTADADRERELFQKLKRNGEPAQAAAAAK